MIKFKLTLKDKKLLKSSKVREWLAQVEKTLKRELKKKENKDKLEEIWNSMALYGAYKEKEKK